MRAIRLTNQPFRVAVGGIVVPLYGDIHRRFDALRMQRAHLLHQQVAVCQVRMHPLGETPGIVIEPTVVAAGEHRHRRNRRFFGHAGERFRVELRADALNPFRGVKVQVYLPGR